jgi:hypothetical protein
VLEVKQIGRTVGRVDYDLGSADHLAGRHLQMRLWRDGAALELPRLDLHHR